jgi:hypothetical protein
MEDFRFWRARVNCLFSLAEGLPNRARWSALDKDHSFGPAVKASLEESGNGGLRSRAVRGAPTKPEGCYAQSGRPA